MTGPKLRDDNGPGVGFAEDLARAPSFQAFSFLLWKKEASDRAGKRVSASGMAFEDPTHAPRDLIFRKREPQHSKRLPAPTEGARPPTWPRLWP